MTLPFSKTKLTPPELARRYHVSPDKVLHWIRTGQLRAINVATDAGGKPRYLIDEADVAAFEAARAATLAPKIIRRRRQDDTPQYIR